MRKTFVAIFVAAASCSHQKPIETPPPAPVVAAPAPAPLPDPTPPPLRLPGDVKPERYRLELTVVPEQTTAAGHVAIDAQVLRPTRVVWLNATGLTLSNAKLAGHAARVIPGGDDFVGLVANSELAPGKLLIETDFVAPIDHTKSLGIYAEKEGSETYAYTFFEPIDARRAFPCFDEPIYKVPWQLTLHVLRAHVALGNAAVESESDEPNGMKKVVLAETKPLPSYLVAFVVGPFDVIDDGVAGLAKTPIRFIVPKGRAGELGWAKEVTPKVVAALEDYFAMPYPYGKLDVAVVPRYWGTMEHPGLVAMGQPLTLIRPEQATRERKMSYANILAHELSHYWFGDYVTLAWWDDTWLNEALGEWSDMNITDAVEPAWHIRDTRVGLAVRGMASDEALATKAIRRTITTKEGIESSFDNDITYFKGSSVMRMFEAYVGAAKWRDFIDGYLKAHAWGNASAEDLLAAVHAQLGPEIEAALRSFLEQPGVPRISAEVSCKDKKIVLHQERSLPAGVRDTMTGRLWGVPVCLRYGDAKHSERACRLLSAASGELPLEGPCPTWTILNAEANGYYRSAIDPAVAKQLLTPGSAIAKEAKPYTAEKLMLISDLRAAVDRDELGIDKVLALAPLIVRDPDERVALAAFVASSYRADVLDDALYQKAIAYTVKTYMPIARKLGWKRLPGDSDERQELRVQMAWLARRDPKLSAEAQVLANRWLDDHQTLSDDMVDPVLYTAAVHGDAALFDRLLALAKKPLDRGEEERALRALGDFTDPALANRALALSLSSDFDLRESLSIVYSVLFKRETHDLGVAFVTAHIDGLLARMRDDEAGWFLGALAGGPCEEKFHEQMAALVAPRAAVRAGTENAVARGLEQSSRCIATFKRELPALTAFLIGAASKSHK